MIISNRSLGRLEALLSTVFNALAFYCVKASPYGSNQVTFGRAILNVIGVYALAKLIKDDLYESQSALSKCITRGMLGMVSIYLMVISNKMLSLSVHTVLNRLNVFGVILLNSVYLGNPFKPLSLIMAAVALFGVLLVIQPGIFGFGSGDGKGLDFRGTTSEYLGLAASGGFLISSSFARIYTSKISREVSILQNIFYLNLCLTLFTGPFLEYDQFSFPLQSLYEIFGVALFAYLFQLANVDSMRREQDPSILAVIQNTVIVNSLLLDHFLFKSSISVPNLIGVILIAISTTILMIKK